MINIEELPAIYTAWRARYADRDVRMERLDAVARGDFSVWDPDEEQIEVRSPNLIQVAIEDTAEAAALMPTLRVRPRHSSDTAKRKASKMERIGASYLDASNDEALVHTTLLDLVAFGFSAWVIWPDYEQRIPLFERRDPRTCYPEPGFRPGDRVQRCMFARELYFTQLPDEYQYLLQEFVPEDSVVWDENTKVTIVEYFDNKELVIGALYEPKGGYMTFGSTTSGYTPVELERIEHRLGVCPVVVGSRFVLDGEFRGQFDQVIDVLEAHARLFGMVLDYADQAVYSDIWVRDLIGEMPYGGGAYIELGPNGAIGRVPPAVTSLNVSDDLDRLMEGIHLGGRWPKTRPGEVDQAIASAKFIEATAGVMNTAIKTYHQILRRMMEQGLRVAYKADVVHFPGRKTAVGILRNQEFVEEYDTRDIDLGYQIRVEYGLGLGRDPAQSAVLHIQYAQAGFISQETVQENIEGISDVARERVRIDLQQLRDMAFARLLQGLETGQLPPRVLIEIAEGRMAGEDIFDLFKKYIVEPQEEAQANALPSGLTPDQMLVPGLPAGPEGAETVPAPPGAPATPPAPPPAPAPPEILSRLGVPTAGGGLLGSQVTS